MDLPGPHRRTPQPDKIVSDENEAYYFFAAIFYPDDAREKAEASFEGEYVHAATKKKLAG